ncbi:MAG: hypothetical protein H7326_06275 [Bdellovibrionaceae bacterium]|nr:hypothetical protein [Pseudobdellovibrionaceae bacterium]
MKPLLKWGLALASLWTSNALAENFVSPLRCKPSESYLEFSNATSELQPFWFQAIGSSPFREKYHDVAAGKSQLFALGDDYTEDTTALAIKTLVSTGIKLQTICKSTKSVSTVEALRSPWKTVKLTSTALPPSAAVTVQLSFVNLSQAKNSVEVLWNDRKIASTKLSPDFASTELTVTVPYTPGGTGHMQFRATAAFALKASDSGSKVDYPVVDEVQVLKDLPAGQVRYFEFRSANQDESFIAPVTGTPLINETLEQIANPAIARLFVARISAAADNTNRNLLSSSKSPWSWQVVEAQNYADFAHISCDGSPAVIEERITDWMKNTGGTICFWNYRAFREVLPNELKQTPLSSHLGRRTLPRIR